MELLIGERLHNGPHSHSEAVAEHVSRFSGVRMLLLLLGALLVGGYFILYMTVLKLPRCKSTAKLHGKTAVITGELAVCSLSCVTSTPKDVRPRRVYLKTNSPTTSKKSCSGVAQRSASF